ncbi:MAG TPA: MobV family relaxase, partial [Treponemataceae bacterium]|nr:MobV family relaxase [Treponemataceae bacterium]
RTEKLKKGDLGGMAHHHDRSRQTLNADPEKKLENKLIAGVESAKVPEIINSRITEIEERQGKKTRKDAVVGIEVLMTASPEWFAGKEEWQIKAWSERSVEWAKKHFGENNIISAVLHRDESTPHIHLVAFPETPEKKLTAKHWLDGVEKMQAMQDGYAEAVKHSGLERGIKGSKARHIDIKRWYAEGLPKAREQVKAMTERAKELGISIERSLERQFFEFAKAFAPQKKLEEKEIERTKEPEKERNIHQEIQRAFRKKDKEKDRGFSR